jgi:flagellar protein FlaJ
MGIISSLAAFVSRVFPGKFLAGLDRTLASTKIALAVDEYVALSMIISIVLSVVVGIIGVFISIPLPPIVLAPIVGVVAFCALVFFVPRYLSQRRAEELERVLPDALRQMASTLRAGVSIDAALEDISNSNYGELSKEFTRVVNEVSRGRTLESALLALARRSNAPLYDRAFHLIVEGIERGAALANVLDSVANDAKEIGVIQRERKTTTMQPIMFLFAVALFAAPFIIGITVGVGSIQVGAAGSAGNTGLPPEIKTIAMMYVMIQGFVCGLAVGVIRFGKMTKGISYSIMFLIAGLIVFTLAGTMAGSMGASTA